MDLVGVGDTHADVTVRPHDQKRVAVDAVIAVGVALVVDYRTRIEAGSGRIGRKDIE